MLSKSAVKDKKCREKFMPVTEKISTTNRKTVENKD